MRVLDPACGSGNFLYVSLKELLDLEKEVSSFMGTVGLTPFFPEVSPEQLYGIETSPYAHELAQVAVWIGYLQWMHDNGFGTRREPILGPMTNIKEMDALMVRDESGELWEPDWPEADVILGNPPFLGGKRTRSELGDEYVEDLHRTFAGRLPPFADLVCYFFERARAEIAAGRTKRAGLLATNSIRGGANRAVLDRIKAGGDIFMAWADEPWVLKGAAVRISIVGFDDGAEQERYLDGRPVASITSGLTVGADLSLARRLSENESIAFTGDQPTGPFDVPEETARVWLAQPPNPNGRPNADVLRPFIGGADIVRRNQRRWIVDFGVDMPEDEAALYEAPFEYVRENVRPTRATNKVAKLRDVWWLHWNPRPHMRAALQPFSRYIVTPHVSRHRIFVWLDQGTLPSNLLIAFARDDDYFFGILHSHAHELWALRMGTSLEDRPRYTPTTCFETFAFPEPGEAGEQRGEISAAAKRLDELRRNWLNPEDANAAELKKRTLTNLYNARPTWLANAHARLDAAVYAAYGWPADLADEEVLKNLLALNVAKVEAWQREEKEL